MKRIGVITLYRNYNYGSVLQCYALQTYLKKIGYSPVAICQIEGKKRTINKSKRLTGLFLSCLFHPKRIKSVIRNIKESRRSCKDLPINTVIEFDKFIKENIKEVHLNVDELKTLAKSDDYVGFLSGSDQVWSLASYFLNPVHFLKFAPKFKRFSYAASFGSDFCPIWYKRKLGSFLRGYKQISIREESGKRIIESYGLNAQISIDPTLLLTVDEWSSLSSNLNYSNYIFVYFLNKPSKLSIDHIKKILIRNPGMKVVVSPYSFSEFSDISNDVILAELSPSDFINVIKNAFIICTDSFHGVVFSINFKKIFYVYYRQYEHDMPQNGRIETILNHYSLQNQYVYEIENNSIPDYSNIDEIINNDRESSRQLLSSISEV